MLETQIRQLLGRLEQGPEGLDGTGIFRYQAIDVPPLPLLPWLAGQTHHPKLYWSSKDDIEETAAIGCCFQIQARAQLPMLVSELSGDMVRFYGGLAFTPQLANWPDFGDCRLLLPRLELRRRQNRYQLICFVHLSDASHWPEQYRQARAMLQSLQAAIPAIRKPNPILTRHDQPDRQHWQRLVEQVTDANFQRHTAKVVLSRATRLHCRDPIDPWPLLAAWQDHNPNCFQFAFHFGGQRIFIGCSPERLFKRKGRALITEALAGTSRRSDLPDEERRLANILLTDAKIRRENTLVVEDIRQRLAALCDGIEVAPASILKLLHVQHLKHRIHGYLNENTSDAQLLDSLHPTPAVGGTPREQALAFICQHEPYQRGWYAGACGYLSEQRSEFCVAIRSALIDHRDIRLFAGAGIVSGSDAEQEWQELNTKIHTLMTLLEG